MNLEGQPVVRTDDWINFEPANQAPDPFLPKSPLSIRWTGKLKPTVSGTYTFGFTSDDGCRLFIDGEKLIDSWYGRGVTVDSVRINLEAGKTYQLQAEYFDNRDVAVAKLAWRIPVIDMKSRLDLFGEAGKAVKECDMAIAVIGTNKSIEREGQDRHDIDLPKDQQEFIQEIYKVNPNTVVVLVSGSSLAINWINENIPAIVNAWYPGEQGGTAVADVLFGDYNPAGRLPLTYYNNLSELPSLGDYDITKGRTYQYFEGKPLYPFGYGLSYTTFNYTDINIHENGEAVSISFNVKNTGQRDGDEVSQVYVKLPETGQIMPLKQLKGFQRTTLKKNESKKIEIKILKEQLRYWDEQTKSFITPKGNYHFMIGASSEDIRLEGSINL
jgi:beta-glucosidase